MGYCSLTSVRDEKETESDRMGGGRPFIQQLLVQQAVRGWSHPACPGPCLVSNTCGGANGASCRRWSSWSCSKLEDIQKLDAHQDGLQDVSPGCRRLQQRFVTPGQGGTESSLLLQTCSLFSSCADSVTQSQFLIPEM